MSKKNQLLISFILLLYCIGAIVYSINFSINENKKESYRDVTAVIQQDKNIKNTEVYHEFLMNYDCQGQEYYYSFIELSGYDYPILLLSDGVYKDNNGQDIAMWTDIYYPVKSKVMLFGNISSVGTAYPISADTTGIYTAGGHEAAKYDLDMERQKLKLINKYSMFFYKTGEKVDSVSVKITGNENKIVTEEEFNNAYEEYTNAKVIYFNPYDSTCM